MGKVSFVLADRTGNVYGFTSRITTSGLTIMCDEEEVSVSWNSDYAYTGKGKSESVVETYYINSSAKWRTAKQAETLSWLLGEAAAIGKELEGMGVAFKS